VKKDLNTEHRTSDANTSNIQHPTELSARHLKPSLLAGCLTMGLFLVLPYVHVVDPTAEPTLALVTIEPVDWQAPPLPPPQREAEISTVEPLPKPALKSPRPQVAPLQAVLDFDVGLANVGGDFDMNFVIDSSTGEGLALDTIFALSDLDSGPQPVVQLRPQYPVHARMRQIEGSVDVEFVVFLDGRTGDVTVRASEPGSLFVSAAVRAIEHWRFNPGTRDGDPVAARVHQRIRFQLEK